MTDLEFEALIERGHETNGVEFKGPGLRSEKAFLAKVARAVLGMANRRDGGLVILGVNDNGEMIGLNDEQLKEWQNFDVVSEAINHYADPNIEFDLEAISSNGKHSIILHVYEFTEIPILCRSDFQFSDKEKSSDKKTQILRKGGLYVRSRHKPETAEVRSEQELRELLELAVDKGLRKFVERARNAGLYPSSPPPLPPRTDKERYDEQLEDLP
jgi:predicted HTH transcriptional regulator